LLILMLSLYAEGTMPDYQKQFLGELQTRLISADLPLLTEDQGYWVMVVAQDFRRILKKNEFKIEELTSEDISNHLRS